MLNQPSEHNIQILGQTIFVKKWTPAHSASEIPILLLHDSLGSIDLWKTFPQLLCETTQRQVIAYDRLGFGKSQKREGLPSRNFVSEEAEQYLPLILRELGVDRVVLFGHSVGGAMAIAFASQFSDRCEAVITESSQAFVENKTREGIIKAKIDFKNPDAFAKLKKYHGDKTQWVLDAWIDVWLSDAFSSWSLAPLLPKVKCPVLTIHGDRDEYGSLKFPEMIYNLSGGSKRMEIIADCGHVPHREKPDLILNLVSNFLSQRVK